MTTTTAPLVRSYRHGPLEAIVTPGDRIHVFDNTPPSSSTSRDFDVTAISLETIDCSTAGGDPVLCVAFNNQSTLLAAGVADGTVRLMSATVGAVIATLTHATSKVRHAVAVRAVAFSPCGRILAAAGADKTISLWDPKTLQLHDLGEEGGRIKAAHYKEITSLAFSACGKYLASGSADCTARIFDVSNVLPKRQLATPSPPCSNEVKPLHSEPLWEHTKPVTSVAFSPDSTTLLTGSADTSCFLWDVVTGKPKTATPSVPAGQSHTAVIESVAFTAGGRRFVTCGWDRRICVFDSESCAQVLTLELAHGLLSCCIVPDDPSLIVCCGALGRLYVWDLATQSVSEINTGHTGRVEQVAVGRGGATATASEDGTVKLWHVVARSKPIPASAQQQSISVPAGVASVKFADDESVLTWTDRAGGAGIFAIQKTTTKKSNDAPTSPIAAVGECSKCAALQAQLEKERAQWQKEKAELEAQLLSLRR